MRGRRGIAAAVHIENTLHYCCVCIVELWYDCVREKHRSEGRSHLTHCIVILCTTYIIRGYIPELGLLEEGATNCVCVYIYSDSNLFTHWLLFSISHVSETAVYIYTRGKKQKRRAEFSSCW